jgi:hypothetical protein
VFVVGTCDAFRIIAHKDGFQEKKLNRTTTWKIQELSRDENEEESSNNSSRRKSFSSKENLFNFRKENKKMRNDEAVRWEASRVMQERLLDATEKIAGTGERFIEMLERKWFN